MKTIKQVTLFLVALLILASLNSCFYRINGHRRWWWHHHHDFNHAPVSNTNDGHDLYDSFNSYQLNRVIKTDTMAMANH